MTSHKPPYQTIAEAETLLIYGIFLFVTGLAQIGVTVGYRYITEKSNNNIETVNFSQFLATSFNLTDIHFWFVYPSASLVSYLELK